MPTSAGATQERPTDTDGDGLSDDQEFDWGTDPSNPDSDGGGAGDGWEVAYGLDPSSRADDYLDSDGDGLDNYAEYLKGTNPTSPDTDGDGLGDFIDPDPLFPNGPWVVAEGGFANGPGENDTVGGGSGEGPPEAGDVLMECYVPGQGCSCGPPPNGTDESSPSPPNPGPGQGQGAGQGAGLANGNGQGFGQAAPYWAMAADSDGDGLDDATEDSNGNGLVDEGETSPFSEDTDGDELSDLRERTVGTDPTRPDTDGDGLSDSSEILRSRTDPLSRDTDRDGLIDGEETGPLGLADFSRIAGSGDSSPGTFVRAGLNPRHFTGTNPFEADSDGDGISDAFDDEDQDGLVNLVELRHTLTLGSSTFSNPYWGLSDPRDATTDCDALGDGEEVDGSRSAQGIPSNPAATDTDGDALEDDVDPDPQTPTRLIPSWIREVRVNGIELNGKESVDVRIPGPFTLTGRLETPRNIGDLMASFVGTKMELHVYFVQWNGISWEVRRAGPTHNIGLGAFAVEVPLDPAEVAPGPSYLYLQVDLLGHDPSTVLINRTSWREPGSPEFEAPPFRACLG